MEQYKDLAIDALEKAKDIGVKLYDKPWYSVAHFVGIAIVCALLEIANQIKENRK